MRSVETSSWCLFIYFLGKWLSRVIRHIFVWVRVRGKKMRNHRIAFFWKRRNYYHRTKQLNFTFSHFTFIFLARLIDFRFAFWRWAHEITTTTTTTRKEQSRKFHVVIVPIEQNTIWFKYSLIDCVFQSTKNCAFLWFKWFRCRPSHSTEMNIRTTNQILYFLFSFSKSSKADEWDNRNIIRNRQRATTTTL